MFKYFKFKKIKTDITVYDFKNDLEAVETHLFDNVVSLSGTKTNINKVINSQFPEIEIKEITKGEFISEIKGSRKYKLSMEYRKPEIYENFSLQFIVKDITDAIDYLIQSKIDQFNEIKNIYIQDINSTTKYINFPDYIHYNFCYDILEWSVQVWEKAREIQDNYLENPDKGIPTIEDVLAQLPEFDVTVY